MPTVFVLLNTEYGGEESVIAELKNIVHVKKAIRTHGQYDIMAILSGSDIKTIQKATISKIRKILEVRSILCLIVANEQTAQISFASDVC